MRAEPFNNSVNVSEDEVNSGDTMVPIQNMPILSRMAKNVRNVTFCKRSTTYTKKKAHYVQMGNIFGILFKLRIEISEFSWIY